MEKKKIIDVCPVPEKPIWGRARKLKDDPFFKELFDKPKFHLDILLLWLCWIIMGGLFVYLSKIIPRVIETIMVWLVFPLGVLGLISIFLRSVCEVDIIEMVRRWKKN